jgi:nitronate monooxygenase
VHGNYLKASIVAAGLDPEQLPVSDPTKMNFGSKGASHTKAWKDIWGSGQGIGAVRERRHVSDEVDRLEAEYRAARARLCSP